MIHIFGAMWAMAMGYEIGQEWFDSGWLGAIACAGFYIAGVCVEVLHNARKH